jgi:hypothetical protein
MSVSIAWAIQGEDVAGGSHTETPRAPYVACACHIILHYLKIHDEARRSGARLLSQHLRG